MAAAIQEAYGVEPELVGGHGGIFLVEIDGEQAFRNDPAVCGVPEPAEVVEALRGKL